MECYWDTLSLSRKVHHWLSMEIVILVSMQHCHWLSVDAGTFETPSFVVGVCEAPSLDVGVYKAP